ncbi:uncharacterized protein LOC108911818 [Anoplophora glabripennis]|uniref:uncharacterized protein LOC108911818 n=1 Tax=Anoplophora glabripennis TaxID=217634 RepID=UPI00087387B3|nr:uncharacterized protein LOC108911818 [Anoplophora glabripennis]
MSENGLHAVGIWALHGYLVPTTKIIKKDVTGKKTTTKFTIKESQESVIFVGDNLIEVEDRINHLKRTKQSLQPSIYRIELDTEILEFIRKTDFLQEYGSPAHSTLLVRNWLDVLFPNKWIGRYGPIPWPARVPDMSPLDYFL